MKKSGREELVRLEDSKWMGFGLECAICWIPVSFPSRYTASDKNKQANHSYYLNNLGQDHELITTAITNTYRSSSQTIFHVPHSWLQPSRDKYNGSERKLVQQIYITSL